MKRFCFWGYSRESRLSVALKIRSRLCSPQGKWRAYNETTWQVGSMTTICMSLPKLGKKLGKGGLDLPSIGRRWPRFPLRMHPDNSTMQHLLEKQGHHWWKVSLLMESVRLIKKIKRKTSLIPSGLRRDRWTKEAACQCTYLKQAPCRVLWGFFSIVVSE